MWTYKENSPKDKTLVKRDLFFIPDNGYFSEESYDHLIPTAWIPFLDAKPENGCMQVSLVICMLVSDVVMPLK